MRLCSGDHVCARYVQRIAMPIHNVRSIVRASLMRKREPIHTSPSLITHLCTAIRQRTKLCANLVSVCIVSDSISVPVLLPS